MKTLQKQIEYCLNLFPETRNSDIELTTRIWREFHQSRVHSDSSGQIFVFLRDIIDLPREDHVKRIRAKLQNEERIYLPTDVKIMVERAKASKEWREFLGYRPEWTDLQWEHSVMDYFQDRKKPDSLF